MTSLDVLKKSLLTPVVCGAYISKPEIQKIALLCGFRIILQERGRMMDEMFATIKDTPTLRIQSFFVAKIDEYQTLIQEFESLEQILNERIALANETVEELAKIKEEIEIEEKQ